SSFAGVYVTALISSSRSAGRRGGDRAALDQGRGDRRTPYPAIGVDRGSDPRDHVGDELVERPVERRQGRRGQVGHRLVVVPEQGDVVRDIQAELPAGGVHAEGHRVGEREDAGRPRRVGEQGAGDLGGAGQVVRTLDDADLQLEVTGDALRDLLGRPL